MTAITHGLGLVQPYATLLLHGKTIVTMPTDLAGAGIEPGERIAGVALNEAPQIGLVVGGWVVADWPHVNGLVLADNDYRVAPRGLERPITNYPLPLGVVVCTVTVNRSAPAEQFTAEAALWPDHRGVVDQLPLDDFSPGRFGWMLSNPEQPTVVCEECGGWGWTWDKSMEFVNPPRIDCHTCTASGRRPADPIPCPDAQPGVFDLPAEVTEALR